MIEGSDIARTGAYKRKRVGEEFPVAQDDPFAGLATLTEDITPRIGSFGGGINRLALTVGTKKAPKKSRKKGGKAASTGKDTQQLFKKMAEKRARSWVRRWAESKLVDGRVVEMMTWVSDELPSNATGNRASKNTPKSHMCNVCHKSFSDASGLRKHTKIHGEKLFACGVTGCNKRFIDRSKLKRHQLVHTGERPFPCPYPDCNKRFSLDFNLKSHLKLHSGNKPHKCPFPDCGKRFAQISNLKAHKKTHERSPSKAGTSEDRTSPKQRPEVNRADGGRGARGDGDGSGTVAKNRIFSRKNGGSQLSPNLSGEFGPSLASLSPLSPVQLRGVGVGGPGVQTNRSSLLDQTNREYVSQPFGNAIHPLDVMGGPVEGSVFGGISSDFGMNSGGIGSLPPDNIFGGMI